ncbi:MAG TPA: threonine/serine exporter family protein [Rectinemataceae bacterium]|nr:threonine/serine exporter family protein [Rectinemataceae bacterium]
MTQVLLPYLWTALATSAFAVRFGLRKSELLPAAVGAAGGWFVFELASGALLARLATGSSWNSPTLGYFVAALFIGLYAEIVAAVLKKPATIWIVTAIFPLVPGGGMYFTMLNSVRGDLWESVRSGFETLSAAGAIASGLAVSSALSRLLSLRSITRRLADRSSGLGR